MRGRKTSLRVVLTTLERAELEQRLRFMNTSLGTARRCRAILAVADGLPLVEVARLVDLTEKHVRKWVQRFLKERLEGLSDRPGSRGRERRRPRPRRRIGRPWSSTNTAGMAR